MLRILTAIAMIVLLGSFASAAEPSPPSTRPATQLSDIRNGPIHYWHETRSNPPLQLHIVTIDLQDPSVSVEVRPAGADPDGLGPWQTTLMPIRQIAQRDGLDVAVNGNLFASKDAVLIGQRKMPYLLGNWARAVGWAMSDGRLWSAEAAPASLVVNSKGQLRIDKFDRIPIDAREVVSGSQLLLGKGRVQPIESNRGNELSPRTAAGIDAAGHTLIFLVVDGRRPEYSAGMTLRGLADEMLKLGCTDALNLDGGGSSAMAVRDPATGELLMMNRPSDGHDLLIPMSLERSVADVLGVKVRPGK